MRRFTQWFKCDEGTVLIFGLGLAIVLLMCSTVAINLGSAWVTRSHLNSIAEGAALAGAHSFDISVIYDGQDISRVPLSRERAGNAVRSYLRRIQADTQFEDFTVRDVTVVNNLIAVSIQARADLPFGYLLGSRSVVIRTEAEATHLWPSN